MEGYRGGALGFKAASFHAIGANSIWWGNRKTSWILLATHADFRYLRDPEDNPWYPTARLLRQRTEGDWTSVIDLLRPKLN
jgi:hypothetical protein